MYGVVLILVLVITGGAIAFIGDRLGSKIGKKKMTVLGLRPRHTSILITIITGVMITTITLGIMSIMSENVRTALFGMEELNQNMLQAQADLVKASAQVDSAKAEQDKIAGELAGTKKELAGLEEQKNLLAAQTEQLQDINGQLTTDNQRLAQHNLSLQENSDKLTRINNILEEGNERLSKNNSELYEVNRELTTGIKIMREGAIAFRAGETLAVGTIKGRGTIDEIHEQMAQLLEMARYTVAARLQNSVEEEQKDVWIFQPEFEEAAKYISEHDGEYIVRLVAAGNLIKGESVATNLQLFENKIVFKDGELIAQESISFDPNNAAEMQTTLTDFLSKINRKATENGMIPDSVNNSVGIIEAEQIYGILNQMQRSSGQAIISAFAEGATNIIGPLRIKLKLAGLGSL